MSADVRYADEQVRANWDEFYRHAHAYLIDYTGEFPFLIDCRARIQQGVDLTVGMVRGVLNCMRVDPKVTFLPEPEEIQFDADLIPIDRAPSRRRQRAARVDCAIKVPHQHKNEDWEYLHFCPGIYAINRQNGYYRIPASLKPGVMFVKGKSASSVRVHLATHAEVEYWPRPHDTGFYRIELIVHTTCKAPYYLRQPILMTYQQVEDTEDLERCWRCFPNEVPDSGD